MDSPEFSHMAAFFESDLFKHLTVGLNTLLEYCRQDLGVPSAIRYHIVEIQNEKPKLGQTMGFEECDNQGGSPCPKEYRCFNPNFSARDYLYRFLSNPDRFIIALESDDLSRDQFTTLINLYNVPRHHRLSWMTAFANVFRDLFGQNLEV